MSTLKTRNNDVLWNFISPVTGRVLADPNYVLVGNSLGIAIPSPSIPVGSLPDLAHNNIWIGNDNNRPVANATITIDNLPNLASGKAWVGNTNNRPVPTDISGGGSGGFIFNKFNIAPILSYLPAFIAKIEQTGTVDIPADVNMLGHGINNLLQSPEGDYSAVTARWVWDLLNDNVIIEWQ